MFVAFIVSSILTMIMCAVASENGWDPTDEFSWLAIIGIAHTILFGITALFELIV